MWVQKGTSVNDEPQGERGWERVPGTQAQGGPTLPSFLESEGPTQAGGGCTATQGPSCGSYTCSQWWEDPFPNLGLSFWFLGQVALGEAGGRIH